MDIEATPDEVERLTLLFDKAAELDLAPMIRALLPSIPYHHDRENDEYDDCLQEIYRTLNGLGMEQTREHIESMDILPESVQR